MREQGTRNKEQGTRNKQVLIWRTGLTNEDKLRGGINELTLNCIVVNACQLFGDDFFSRRPDEGP
ncbi:hypothetical protein VCR12J2_640358 [Vibrio coralliirubri]|nr:hypothetical protein VCR12J2_640358 [Vibrio coralliirubri]